MKALDFVKRRCGLIILMFVAGYSLVYALAFVRLYFLEHPYKLASYWIFDNVPAGSRLMGPHWDDKVPVGVAGKNPSVYVMEGRDNELPVYEQDTPAIIDGLVRKMSRADYLMFPTARTPDSIPRIPEEYPNTTALLRLLWGEKLGFQLVKTVKNRPSFFGLTFNDDLADESFSVYDHPKVAIFKNVDKLPPEQILARVKDAQSYEPLPTMDEMLLMDAGGWQPAHRWWNPIWSWFACVLALVWLVAVSVWLCLTGIFRKLPDGGLGLSLAVGLGACTGISLILCAIGLVPFTRGGTWFVALACFLVGIARVSLRPEVMRSALTSVRQHGLYVLLAGLSGALIAYVMYSSDPSFFGLGEKIERAYLAYLVQSTASVPQDIFNPGSPLSLRLADRVVFAWLLKLAGADMSVAVPTVSVVAGALIGGLLYSVALVIVRRPRASLLATFVALIPVAYLVHIVRETALRSVVPAEAAELIQESTYSGLIRWKQQTVRGTPCVASVCDNGGLRVASVVMGLPVCERVLSQPGADQQLCGIDDPDVIFKRMMTFGVDLFVTPAAQAARSDAARSRIEQFGQRPDLFTKLFDDGKVAVFLPVYSGVPSLAPARASS